MISRESMKKPLQCTIKRVALVIHVTYWKPLPANALTLALGFIFEPGVVLNSAFYIFGCDYLEIIEITFTCM